ncbi:MAG: aldehyde dehydrogenase, partial [Pseudomonadota bacterium]
KASDLSIETRLFIDGEYKDAQSQDRFETLNPANGDVIASVVSGDASDIDEAVASSRRAFRSGVWSRIEPRERASILQRFADLVQAQAETLAILETLDTGKPVLTALEDDVLGSIEEMRYFAELCDKVEGIVTATRSDALHYVLRQPLGIVGAIVPWNFPLAMALTKIMPALAAGNCVVLKPAEQSPLSAIVLGRLFVEAGGPPGVLNVVPGFGHTAGKALALHNDVDKIGFTGSVEIGKLMLVYAGQSNMKRVTTECGGKSPQIILDDVRDLDAAVEGAVNGIYYNQGEVCCAGSRLLVQRGIYDEFVDRFEKKTRETIVMGHPFDPSTTMGPLVTSAHQKRVLDYIDLGKKEGANLVFGGGEGAGELSSGAYVEPTLFSGVNNSMKIVREEIFGPVTGGMPIDDLSQGLEIANDSIFGLAASVWTSDVSRAHRFARDMEAGVIWVNCYDEGDSTTPFGGFKQSGNGRDGCAETMLEYTQTKSVWTEIGE